LGWYIANNPELSTQISMGVIGLLWLRSRSGIDLKPDTIARGVWLGISVATVAAVWGLVTVVRVAPSPVPFPLMPVRSPSGVLPYLFGLAVALPALGTGSALARVAHQFAPPRIQALRRTSSLVIAFSFIGIAMPAFLFVALVPGHEQLVWANAPLIGIARHLSGANWARVMISAAIIAAAAFVLVPAANAALTDAEKMFGRLAAMTRSLDIAAVIVVLIIFASAGQVVWLGRAYAFAIGLRLIVKLRC
jgi:hypothetical protein